MTAIRSKASVTGRSKPYSEIDSRHQVCVRCGVITAASRSQNPTGLCRDCLDTDAYFAKTVLGDKRFEGLRGNQHAPRTLCDKGHAISGHNIKWRKYRSGNNGPTCLICSKAQSRVRWMRTEGRPITLDESIEMTINRFKSEDKQVVEDALDL